MINTGYIVADEIFSNIFKYGTDKIEYITSYISKINMNLKKEKYNMSGDIAVDRLNSVAKKLIKYNVK